MKEHKKQHCSFVLAARKVKKQPLFVNNNSCCCQQRYINRTTSILMVLLLTASSSAALSRRNYCYIRRNPGFLFNRHGRTITTNRVVSRRFSSPAIKPRALGRFDNNMFVDDTFDSTSSTRLNAQQQRRRRPLHREDYLTINDIHSRQQQRQRPPPTLFDGYDDEDDGFGAYGYDVSLDEYDKDEIINNDSSASINKIDPFIEDDYNDHADADSIEKLRAEMDAEIPVPTKVKINSTESSSHELPSSLPTKINGDKYQSKLSNIDETDDGKSAPSPSKVKSSNPTTKTTTTTKIKKNTKSMSVFDDILVRNDTHTITKSDQVLVTPEIDRFLAKASKGTGTITDLDVLEQQLNDITASIYEQNNGKEFNINAPKQVALALFGPAGGGSTRKEVLEGMAGGGNRMASLILDYRSIKNRINKLQKQQERVEKGTNVRSVSTVARVAQQPQVEWSTSSSSVQQHVEMADPLLLVDASAYIFRAYYSMPPIHRPDGMPTGAVMGFCKMLNSLLLRQMIEGERPRLVLCFDAKGKTFRHDMYKDYKGNRPVAPMDLIPQFDLVRQAAEAYGICQIEADTYEADDIIATLASMAIKEGVDTNILSGDKDLMQLVTDMGATPSIQLIDPMKKDRTTYPEVVEKWGVPPNKLGDVLALAGDTADNVPGVRGIGPKTAAKLITEFESLDNLLNCIDEVKQKGVREKLQNHCNDAKLSRKLVELDRNVPIEKITGFPNGVNKVSELRMQEIDPDRILAFYDQMGFRELKSTFLYRLNGVKPKRKKQSSFNKKPKAEIPKPEDFADVPF